MAGGGGGCVAPIACSDGWQGDIKRGSREVAYAQSIIPYKACMQVVEGGADSKICLEAATNNEVWLTPSRGAGRVLWSITPCSTRN